MKRSRHVAIQVPPEEFESAVEHYERVFGLDRGQVRPGSQEMVGPNWTLWIDATPASAQVMQEFVASKDSHTPDFFRQAGCEIFDESEFGFHVRDRYGLVFHVWTHESDPDDGSI